MKTICNAFKGFQNSITLSNNVKNPISSRFTCFLPVTPLTNYLFPHYTCGFCHMGAKQPNKLFTSYLFPYNLVWHCDFGHWTARKQCNLNLGSYQRRMIIWCDLPWAALLEVVIKKYSKHIDVNFLSFSFSEFFALWVLLLPTGQCKMW